MNQDTSSSTQYIRSASSGHVSSLSQLYNAEIGLSVDTGRNPGGHPLYPDYCFLVRILSDSIDDFVTGKLQWHKEAELEFWRNSRMFIHYGLLVCEIEAILFGRDFTLDDLRRGAEARMGLAHGALAPSDPLTHVEEERVASEVKRQFAFIAETIVNVPDPIADKRFDPHRASKAKAAKSAAPKAADLPAIGRTLPLAGIA